MPVRMKDIARDLGISVMAVSKALRNHGDIGAETKARVLKRAAELDYRVDWVARSMATGRTYLVGLVVPDLMQSFFAEIATALAAALAPAGYHVVIAHTGESADEEVENIDVLVARKVDGLVIASAQHDARRLRALETPYVLIDRRVPGLDANHVGCSDEALGAMATEHLIAQGCTHVAHLRGPDSSAGEGRLAGYRAALARHGLDGAQRVVEAGHDDGAGYRAMQALLAGAPRRGGTHAGSELPDGLFCFNDPVAAGAMRAILEVGLSIPRDIALIGAANMHYADLMRVPLSTIDQGTSAMAEQTAHLLLEAMAAAPQRPAPRQIAMPLRLLARESSLRAGRKA